MKKVLVAMSGGVDSSVAARLIIDSGYECAGAAMRLFENDYVTNDSDAQKIASTLGIPFYTFDFIKIFTETVINRFASAYQNGLTPNPCVECNRFVKFGAFLQKAVETGYDRIATGHYARVKERGGRYLLYKGADNSKDQSYFLYSMTQEQLLKTIFPVGGLLKNEVREIAAKSNFLNAKKRDSQDICFAPDNDYAGFIKKNYGITFERGRFVDAAGNDLGEHKGIVNYTVGQRKKLGLSADEPLYVIGIRAAENIVVVGKEEELYTKTLTARDVNLIPFDSLDGTIRATAKIRSRQPEQKATVRQTGTDILRVEFDEPQRAVTYGQAVVLYDGDTVIGGGTIVYEE